MISVARGMNPWGMGGRWLVVPLLAMVAMGQVYASIELGDISGRDFTAFVLMVFLYSLARSLLGCLGLALHKRRVKRLPTQIDGQELGGVLANGLRDDRSPFVGVLRSMHEQYTRNPAAVDAEVLIDVLHRRLSAGPRQIERAASLSLALGFCGTAFGLVLCLNGLSMAVDASGGDGARLMELLFSPGGPMASLGGAYLSTLAALACGSIVLRSLAHVQQDAIDALTDQFTEIVAVYVRPSFCRRATKARALPGPSKSRIEEIMP